MCKRCARFSLLAITSLMLVSCQWYGELPTTQKSTADLTTGLNNPTDILAGTDGGVIVAESGAGRVVTIDSAGTITPLITGFDMGTYSPWEIGPLSIAQGTDGLIVGEGGNRSGGEKVSFYGTDGTASGDPLIPLGGNDFYAVAEDSATGRLFIASTGTNKLFVAEAADEGYDEPVAFIEDTTASPYSAGAPSALAFNAEGQLLIGFSQDGAGAIHIIDPTAEDGQLGYTGKLTTTENPVMDLTLRPSDSAVAWIELSSSGQGKVYAWNTETGTKSTLAGALSWPVGIAFGTSPNEDSVTGEALFVCLLGRTPNASSGSISVIDTVNISTNGS